MPCRVRDRQGRKRRVLGDPTYDLDALTAGGTAGFVGRPGGRIDADELIADSRP
jgi:hypothetical protein